LDGASHQVSSRKNRDEKFNRLYEKVALKYLHVKVGADFQKQIVKVKNQLLKNDSGQMEV